MSTIVFGDFEWNEAKAASNLAKHGISFIEAADALADPYEVLLADSLDESRVLSLVLSPVIRVLLVVSIVRGVRIRLISARKATPHEERIYQEKR